MHYTHVATLDALLLNALEEKRVEANFTESLKSMTEDQRNELPECMVRRFRFIRDQLALDVRSPALAQARSFIDRRLQDLEIADWADEFDRELENDLRG